MGPQVLQPLGQGQAGLELAVLPLVAHPVDEQLAGPRIVALLGDGRAQVRPDDVVGGPVGRVVGLALAGPGADQDLVHLVPRLDLLLVGHLGADHRLDEPVDLQRVAALIHLDQGEPADIPDHPAEHQLLAQRLIERQQGFVHLVAVEQVHRDRPGEKNAQSCSSRTAAGDRCLSRSKDRFQVATTGIG